MNIGFDAKRAYQNTTGLGHYSRTLISSLATFFPENDYYLYTPKITNKFDIDDFVHMHALNPIGFPSAIFKRAWRSNWVKKDLLKNNINIYHGLSHEIPVGLAKKGIKSVVTIHDLIFEHYPKQYNPINCFIYRKKIKYACHKADKIIAISLQTKKNLIDLYKIPENKIEVCYQSCNTSFNDNISQEKKEAVRQLYNLPQDFYLYVGSIIERKNLLLICKALKQVNTKLPLVVIGNGTCYKQKVKTFIAQNEITKQVIFLSEKEAAKSSSTFQSSKDFPAIYQLASAMIYPSFFEGFGIPVLEALCSRLPVITSNVSCMPETAGDAALFVNPNSVEEMTIAMQNIITDNNLRNKLITNGIAHALKFSQQKCAQAVMSVYKNL